MISCEFVWFNSIITVDSESAHFYSYENLNFIVPSFNDTGNIKPLEDIKILFHFKDAHKIHWLQFINAL